MKDSTSKAPVLLPREPIDRLIAPFKQFMHVEAASGIVLMVCTVIALILANSPAGHAFHAIWETPIGFRIGGLDLTHSLHHWINDALMALFFFVVGLEVKREVTIGELRDVRKATLPVVAAIGGMVFPALVYLVFQFGKEGQHGWGIPMATDIAFVVGCMAVMGSRVPNGLRIMLLTLAIVDDIGAILVIAFGYTSGIEFGPLIWAAGGIILTWIANRIGVRGFTVYVLLGVFVWLAFFLSGIHATIAGVIMGLMTPTKAYLSENRFAEVLERATNVLKGGEWSQMDHRGKKLQQFRRATREIMSPGEYLESSLHPWVGFVIMPLFAFANAGVVIELSALSSPISVAVIAGLVIGKPLGIVLASWLAIKTGIARLPDGVNWHLLLAGGLLGGIGFTMALFVSSLAMGPELLDEAKLGVLAGSVISMLAGIALIWIYGAEVSPETREPRLAEDVS